VTTSNFRNAGGHAKAVAICRFPPRNWRGRRYYDLAPKASMLKGLEPEAFDELYQGILDRLDPRKVYEELGDDAVLLCYEPPGERCHRRMVAAWFGRELKIEVPELDTSGNEL
jgi:hypothetical protein